MARNPSCTMFIGNLDEKVTDRVLYEILIQVGRVVDLYIPMDKETNRHKGYAFAEYESEEIANYAVRLFSGLVCLHNRTLRFSMSGQDKPSQQHNGTPVTPKSTSLAPLPREKKPYQGSAELTDFSALTNSRYSAASVNPSPSSGLLPRLQHPLNPRESPLGLHADM
ncbi:unnamed protein product [Spirodela intermedia]|uniref:RRM domain-containing protein n=1 Tax=Spirodela intermedia TaxID=51605 RepID=A0A7I8J1A6_SPIIN|nr:unnamed protein product [Spirodela intermedia]CAA6663928.1 unnamed protein product [Spirodela intermedia]